MVQQLPSELHASILYNLTPKVEGDGPEFFTLVFTILQPQDEENPEAFSWDCLLNLAKPAMASMLRQMHAIRLDLPVFGVLFRGTSAAMHVGWWENGEDHVVSGFANRQYQLHDYFIEDPLRRTRPP